MIAVWLVAPPSRIAIAVMRAGLGDALGDGRLHPLRLTSRRIAAAGIGSHDGRLRAS